MLQGGSVDIASGHDVTSLLTVYLLLLILNGPFPAVCENIDFSGRDVTIVGGGGGYGHAEVSCLWSIKIVVREWGPLTIGDIYL